jgi:hypothetical protein
MSSTLKMVAVMVVKAVLSTLRFTLFILLLLVGRLLMPVANLVTVFGLLAFFVALIFLDGRTDMRSGMMVLGVCMAAGATALTFGYNTLLALLAPAGTVLVHEL